MSKPYVLITIVALFFCAALTVHASEDRSMWKDGKRIEGAEYDKLETAEKDKLKAAADEFGVAIMMKDRESLAELSTYDGFQFDKNAVIDRLIYQNYNPSGFSCTNIEVIYVKLKNDFKEGIVGAKVHFSTMDSKGSLSEAPVAVQTWKFANKDGKWLFLIDK
jgi:hypothetical protein